MDLTARLRETNRQILVDLPAQLRETNRQILRNLTGRRHGPYPENQ